MLMTSLHVGGCGGGAEPDLTPEARLFCGIHLTAGDANKINGKVQFIGDITLEHYGIVVELDGRIKFPATLITKNIFEPGSDSATVNNSSVYYLLRGKPEALNRNLSAQELLPYRKILRPNSSIEEFSLQIPTNEVPLPPTLSSPDVEVLYSIKVYRRTESGYVMMGQKPLKYYGSRILSECTLEQTPVAEFATEGICGILGTCKKQYLTNEPINFTLDVKRKSKDLEITGINFYLNRVVQVNKGLEEIEQLESFNPKKLPKRAEFVVREVFKNRKPFPSYDNYGLEISYLVKCEIDCGISKICETLEIIVGTSKAQSSTAAQSSEKGFGSMIRSRVLSCVSILSELSLFLPNYSRLPSRAPSVASFETLPPHYDDLPKE